MDGVGSYPTGTTSVPTGQGSADTSSGVCAPYPGLFLTDGTSFATGGESVDTAAGPPPCGPSPPAGPLYWFKADVGTTLVGGKVQDWADQGPNGWDVHCINTSGTVLPSQRLPLVANVVNGLPGLQYFDPGAGQAVGTLNHLRPNGGAANLPIPTALDAPVTVLAIVKRTSTYGGVVVTHKLSGNDHEFALWDGSGLGQIQFLGDSRSYIANTFVNWVGVPIVIDWAWNGFAATPQADCFINGVARPMTNNGAVPAADGVAGFSVGNVNAFGASRGWEGYIVEVIAYLGNDPATRAAARLYLMQRAGLA